MSCAHSMRPPTWLTNLTRTNPHSIQITICDTDFDLPSSRGVEHGRASQGEAEDQAVTDCLLLVFERSSSNAMPFPFVYHFYGSQKGKFLLNTFLSPCRLH